MVLTIFWLAPHCVTTSFLMMLSFLLAFASAFWMCCFYVCHLSKATLTYVCWSTYWSGVCGCWLFFVDRHAGPICFQCPRPVAFGIFLPHNEGYENHFLGLKASSMTWAGCVVLYSVLLYFLKPACSGTRMLSRVQLPLLHDLRNAACQADTPLSSLL